MEFRFRDWRCISMLWGLLCVFFLLGFWNMRPITSPHNQLLENKAAQKCTQNVRSKISSVFGAFMICLKVCFAELNGGEPDNVILPSCATEPVRNISLELFLLQIANVTDYRRCWDTREKLMQTFKDIEMCLIKETKTDKCPCLETFEKRFRDMVEGMTHDMKEVLSSHNSNIFTPMACNVLSFPLVYYSLYTIFRHALRKESGIKVLFHVNIFLVASIHLALSMVIWWVFLQTLIPAILQVPPFAGHIAHIDLDEAMGRDTGSLQVCGQEQRRWRYPGEDVCISCTEAFRITATSSFADIHDPKMVWQLDGRPIVHSKRHFIKLNSTNINDRMIYISSVVIIYNLKKSDFGKYECTLDRRTLQHSERVSPNIVLEILEIRPTLMNVTISPGSVLRIHFSHAAMSTSLSLFQGFSLSKDIQTFSDGKLWLAKNIESCSTMTAFLDLLMIALKGLSHPSSESISTFMMTLCVDFSHYGLHHLEIERQIKGVRATSRHPVSIGIIRKLGDKVSDGQMQSQDKDLQSIFAVMREVGELVLGFLLLEFHDVIRVIFTTALIWMFLKLIIVIYCIFPSKHLRRTSQKYKVYVVSSIEEKDFVQKFIVDFLEELGHEVYFHERDCPLGMPELSSIQKAISSHQKFVTVITKDFFEEHLCACQWNMIIDELGHRETSASSRKFPNLLIFRSGNVSIPAPTLGTHVRQWDMTSQQNASSESAGFILMAKLITEKFVCSTRIFALVQKLMLRFRRAFLVAWINEWLLPEMSMKLIFCMSCIAVFSHPTLLVLVPYRSEILNILWVFIRSWY